MSIDTTLRLLTKASGLSVTDIATAIPRAGVNTVSAWLKGDKLPGKDQLDALARLLGVPASALLNELSATIDPRSKDELDLVTSYRALDNRQQVALLELAAAMSGRRAPRRQPRSRAPRGGPGRRRWLSPLLPMSRPVCSRATAACPKPRCGRRWRPVSRRASIWRWPAAGRWRAGWTV